MDDLLVPEVSMQVDDCAEPIETNGDGDCIALIDDNEEDPLSCKEVSSEQPNGDVVMVLPEPEEPNNDFTSLSHKESNGDIVDLAGDDDEPSNKDTDACDINKQGTEMGCNGEGPYMPMVINTESSAVKDIDTDISNDSTILIAKQRPSTKSSKVLLPDQIPTDYTPEELELYNSMFGRGMQAIQFLRLHCTACNVHLGSAPRKQYKRYIHPLLRVLICKQCYTFYGSGEFDKDEDGSELYCRWCGQGGKVLCCATCPYVFCQKCIKGNLGKSKLQEVLDSEDWICFACIPSQTIKLRVIVRALYDYVQSEINLAAELNQPERLTIDYSTCCANRQKGLPKIKVKVPMGKRTKSAASKEDHLENGNVYPKKKKIKLKTLSSLLTGSNDVIHGKTFATPVLSSGGGWNAQAEDEVVCTPDLSLLMPIDDEECAEIPQTEVNVPSQSLYQIPPPLTYTNRNKRTNLQYMDPVQINRPQKDLGYSLPKPPSILINTSTTRPLLSKVPTVPKSSMPTRFPSITPSISISQHLQNNVKVPAKIVPGTKYDWFEKASQFTSRVNLTLSSRLTTLAQEQNAVSTLEGLATIHNNFQEALNNSIKSLTQIRKNLRNDFIGGLKTLKYNATDKPVAQSINHINDDNDVIIVDAPSPIPNPSPPKLSVGRLKLKPVSSLLMESAVITIPDDVLNEPAPPKTIPPKKIPPPPVETSIKFNEINTSIPTNVTPVGPDIIEEQFNPETVALIKRALKESKFELLITENMKVNVPSEISKDMLKRMATVRVLVENKFGPATPRMRPRPGYIPMKIRKADEDDIENMLSSSIVLNISKRKVIDNDNVEGASKTVLSISNEMEHLSNGIL